MVSYGGEVKAEGYSVVKSQADTRLQEGCFRPCEPRVKCRGQARIWRVTATSLGWSLRIHSSYATYDWQPFEGRGLSLVHGKG